MLYGGLSAEDVDRVKKYVINPVEAREATLEKPETLKRTMPSPRRWPPWRALRLWTVAGLENFVRSYGLAMDVDDIAFCQSYFRTEGREPTITEIRMIDTYWSDHCRHTTFNTIIDHASFEDPLLEKAYEDYLATTPGTGPDRSPFA